MLDFGAIETGDEGGEVGFVEDDARAGVVEDAREFARGEADVEGHDDAAGHDDAVIAFEEEMGVEAEVGDAVADLEAEGEKRAG